MHTVEGAYETAGKRTYLPMVLMNSTLLLVLLGLLALYSRLGTRKPTKCGNGSEEDDIMAEGKRLVDEKDSE